MHCRRRRRALEPFAAALLAAAAAGCAQDAPPGMNWIPGGAFTMGTDDPAAPANERPARRVTVAGFWIDAQDVTNAEFRRFVEATKYATTAEKPVDWEELRRQLPSGTPKPEASRLRPGSLVFTPPKGAV
ncbi:MAG TPA: SUMF1/EgtB/PvdO family nonheme iron enzyme, partial [Planctomycetota bacterium]|nr:SUMF1/EgtB/PvdO family nonheme iron enzyme [Planctomycetota bacterium]